MIFSATVLLGQQLIQRPSITPDDQGCQQLLADRLSAIGFDCEHLRFEEVDNLWAVRTPPNIPADAPLFVFAGHTDVVPTGPESEWAYPPFAAEIVDDKLYGRGAADMKGSIAAMIVAVEQFVAAHARHSFRLGFLITSDEEGPAQHGTKAVMNELQTRGEHIDYCIVGEPSSTTLTGDVIKVGRRGSLGGILTVHGQQGHIAYPHLADNAIHRALPLLNELINIEWDQGNDQFPPTRFQISNIHAGTGATNVIPGSIEVHFNLRFSPEITVNEIKETIHNSIQRNEIKAEINWNLSGNPFQTRHGTLIQSVESAIHQITDRTTERSTSGGTSDGRFIAPTGTQVIELGPCNATIHQIDECVNIHDLDVLTQIYLQTLLELNSSGT